MSHPPAGTAEHVFERLVESASDGIRAFDTEYRYTLWNREMERISGLRAADVVGRRAFEVFPFLVETGEDRYFREVLSGRGAVTTEREFVIPESGRRGVYEARYSPLHDATGRVIGGIAAIRDVTERRRDEQERLARARAEAARVEAEASARRFAFLADASTALASSLDLDSTLHKVAELAVPILGDACIVDLYEGGVLRRVAAEHVRADKRGLIDDLRRRYPPTYDSPQPSSRVLRSGEPELLEDVSPDVIATHTRDEGHRDLITRLGFRSHLAVPMMVRGSPVGVIGVAISESARRYGAVDLELAMELARRAALAVENARLHGALAMSERRFRAICDQSPLSMQLVEPSGRVVRVNRAWEKLWGATLDQVPDYDVLRDPQLDALGILPLVHRAFAGEAIEVEPHRYDPQATIPGRTHHDDAVRWVRAFVYPVADDGGSVREIAVVHEDVTERMLATLRLEAIAHAGRTLSASLDAGVPLDEFTRVVVPRLADLCAVALAGDRGFDRIAVHHESPAVADAARRLFEAFPYGPFRPLEAGAAECLPHVTPDVLESLAVSPEHLALLRALELCSWVAVPLVARGTAIGVLLLAFAESRRRHGPADVALAHDLARRAAAAVDNARLYERLRAEDRRKDEFLATLAHELRNPLAPLRSGLEVMRVASDAETRDHARAVMERQVGHMVRLVDDLLDVARVTRGKIDLRAEPLEMARTVSAALEVARPVLDERNVDVRVPAGELVVHGDRTRIVQVISNLLVNAAKFTAPGGNVHIEAERTAEGITLRVRDDGVGIPRDMLTAVFDTFVQVKPANASMQSGLGIGLTLVRRLVELHGGRVWAESEGPGRGSTFVVVLPAAPFEAPPSSAPKPPPPDTAVKSRRILLVDDHADGASMLASLLTLDGHVVKLVTSAAAALEVVGEFRPEAALLDIGLPEMDGYELARRLRARRDLPPLLLVAVTGWGHADDRRKSREAGFDHHLTKPVEPDVLAALLASIS